MSRYVRAALCVTLVLLPGCARGSKPAELKNQNLTLTVSLKATGARNFTFSGTAPFVVIAREGEGAQTVTSVAVLNSTASMKSGKTEARAEVGITAGYHGSDTYEIEAGNGAIPPTTGPTFPPPKGSRKWTGGITIVEPGKPAIRFGYPLEPCTLKLDKDATEGSLTCPKLAALDGSTVAVEMTWRP